MTAERYWLPPSLLAAQIRLNASYPLNAASARFGCTEFVDTTSAGVASPSILPIRYTKFQSSGDSEYDVSPAFGPIPAFEVMVNAVVVLIVLNPVNPALCTVTNAPCLS